MLLRGFFFFLMGAIFKVLTEFVTILLLFLSFGFLVIRQVVSHPLSQGRTHSPGVGRQSLNHWTAREVPGEVFKASVSRQICRQS